MIGIIILGIIVIIFITIKAIYGNVKDVICNTPIICMICGKNPLGFLEDVTNDIVAAIRGPVEDVVDEVKDNVLVVIEFLKNLPQWLVVQLRAIAQKIIQPFIDVTNTVLEKVKQAFTLIKDTIMNVVYVIRDGFVKVFNNLNDAINWLVEQAKKIIDALKVPFNLISKYIMQAIDVLGSGANTAINETSKAMQTAVSETRAFATNNYSLVSGAVTNLYGSTANATIDGINFAQDLATLDNLNTMANEANSVLSDAGGYIQDGGNYVLEGGQYVWQGVTSGCVIM